MPQISIDSEGFPVLLADVPNAGVSRTAVDQESGNDAHDVASGKFTKKDNITPGAPAPNPSTPANTDPLQYKRQMDAVRDLAREFDDLAEGDIEEFLSGRTQRPLESQEIQQFMALVRGQRVDDLVDILDYQFRGLVEGIKRGRRKVRVNAPRGWMQRTVNGLEDDEIVSVIHRLMARGHKADDLRRSFLNRIKPKRRAGLEVKLSDLEDQDADKLELSLQENSTFNFEDDVEDDQLTAFAEVLSQWQPAINVTVPVTVENKPTKKRVVRDPKTKLVQYIEETVDENVG